jgi:hypothetical protein
MLGKQMLACLDQDGRPPKDNAETRRWLRMRGRDGGCELAGWLDREAAEVVRAALSPLAAPRPATDIEVDLRHRGAARCRRPRRTRLAGLGQRRSDDRGRTTPPGRGHGEPAGVARPHRVGLAGAGRSDQRRGRPPRRCDAELIPVVLGARGEPLDLGRASRTVPSAIRRAVLLA